LTQRPRLSGLAQLSVSGFIALAFFFIGGLLFGIGWGILGYCPGTAAGALGEGRIDGLWGVLGIFRQMGPALFLPR
jgi:uncharacterized membrane protein YedE/YeeE